MLFPKKTNAETSTMRDVRNAILSELGNETPGTEAYDKLIEQLERIDKMYVKQTPAWYHRVDPTVFFTGTVTLLATGMIIRHEQFNVITSKAVGFLPKLMK